MAADVLKEAVRRPALGHDAGHMRPQVPGVSGSGTLAGDAERLARIPAMYDVNEHTPRSGVKGCDVAPDRSPVKDSIRHPSEEDVLAERFFFDVADGPVSGDDEMEPEIEPTDSGA